MLTKIEDQITYENVKFELDELEETYRVRRKKLRALLGVLKAEAGEEKGDTTDAVDVGGLTEEL